MKASFFRRISAYFLDIIIVGLLVSIVVSIILPTNDATKLREELSIVSNDLVKGNITSGVYLNRVLEITHDIGYQMLGYDIMQFTFYVLYFIVFQAKNKGQTIGKKIMRIRIVSSKGNNITMDEYVKRSLIINSLLLAMVSLVGILIFNDTNYFSLIVFVGILQLIIIVISSLMVFYRRDGRGLQDLFANTKVILDKKK